MCERVYDIAGSVSLEGLSPVVSLLFWGQIAQETFRLADSIGTLTVALHRGEASSDLTTGPIYPLTLVIY